MAKILINEKHSDIWFERLSTVSYYSETEFEDRLLKHASNLFIEYFVLPFKKTISQIRKSENTTKPDLIFIKRDFSSWILVEVEKGGHTLDHVARQVAVMSKPDFNPVEMSHYIKSKETYIMSPQGTELAYDEIHKLITTQKPQVMVIVDETKVDWEKDLNKKDVLLCVVQVYKNGQGEEIFRIKGQYPRIYTGTIHCKLTNYPPNSIELVTHHPLLENLTSGQDVEIQFNNSITKWSALINNRKRLFLKCIGSTFPLPVGKDYILQIDQMNKIYYFSYN